jgi:uncharacterized Rmd1/YagE family protein
MQEPSHEPGDGEPVPVDSAGASPSDPGREKSALPARATGDLPPQSRPLNTTPRKLIVAADYYDGPLNLKLFRTRHPHYPVLASDPLVLEPERGSFVVLTKFGGVVFWNCPDELLRQFREDVAALPGIRARCDEVQDQLEVEIGPRTEVEFERVSFRELTVARVKILSRALAQSVALDYFENRLNQALAKTEPVVVRLREHGTLSLNEREVVQAVGFALTIRANVLSNLTLFDDPPEAWESASIARLITQLWEYFDLEERLSAVNQKVGFLTDLNSTLLGLQSNRKSRRLEWTVIALIFVEIVLFILLEMRR